MPRRTPVKELQKEEPTVSSPLRRSTRLSTSSPAPTKIITRRNSASEAAPAASTPKATRGRRSSFNQESETAEESKKTASTVRSRRSSITKNIEEPIQEEPDAKPRTRGSSVPKDQLIEVKKTTRRRKSATDDSEPEEEPTKKVTRTRSGSINKKTESDDTKAVKKQTTASTVKKTASKNDEVLESTEDVNKEDESPKGTPTKSRKRNTEVVKADLNLSVINEASITEEEPTPQKKNKSFQEKNEEISELPSRKDQESEKTKTDKNKEITTEESKLNSFAKNTEESKDSSSSKKTEGSKVSSPAKKTEESNVSSPAQKTEEFKVSSPAKKTEEYKVSSLEKKTEESKVSSPAKKIEEYKVSSPAKNIEESKDSSSSKKTEGSKNSSPVKKTEKSNVSSLAKNTEESKVGRSVQKTEESKLNSSATKLLLSENKIDLKVNKEVHQNDDVVNVDEKSEDSFTLELSYGGPEIDVKQNGTLNVSDKENVSPKKPQEECEPMDVDESVLESSPIKKSAPIIGKVSVVLKKVDIEKTIKMAEKVNDEITEFLSENISPSKDKKEPFIILERENLGEKSKVLKNMKENEKLSSPKVTENVENESTTNVAAEKSKQIMNGIDTITEHTHIEYTLELKDKSVEQTTTVLNENLIEKTSKVDDTSHGTKEFSKDLSSRNLVNEESSEETKQDSQIAEESIEKKEKNMVSSPEKLTPTKEQQLSDSPAKKYAVETSEKEIVDDLDVDYVLADEECETNFEKNDRSDKTREKKNPEDDIVIDKSVEVPQTVSEVQEQTEESCLINEGETVTDISIPENESLSVSTQKIDESDANETNIEEKTVSNNKIRTSIDSFDSPIVIGSETASEVEVDLEVQTINANKDHTYSEQIDTPMSDVSVAETAELEESFEKETTYKSLATRRKSHVSISDDEVFTTRKDKSAKAKTLNVFDRSIDSPYSSTMFQKEPKPEKKCDFPSDEEIFELSDDQEMEKEKEVNKAQNTSEITDKSNNEITETENNMKQNETCTAQINTSLVSNSSRKRSERTSIILHETIKAGENEKRLSGRIYKVVDLFCAGIKNNSDVSINVSLEYTGQDLEDENITDLVEIALAAEEIKSAEPLKGSKRRKICHTLDTEVKSPKVSYLPNENISSPKVTTEEKVNSSKKRKRKSGNLLVNSVANVARSSPKVSFSTDLEDDEKSDTQNNSQLSISNDEQKNTNAAKKALPVTPYKSSMKHYESDEDKSFVEEKTSDEELEEESDDEDVVSESSNSDILGLLSKSFDESDINDTTWRTDEDSESSDKEDSDVEDEEDETEVIKNLSDVESPLVDRKIKSKTIGSITNTESDDEENIISVEQTHPAKQTRKRTASKTKNEEIKPKDLSPGKKRKLFRLSRHNVQQALALETSESDENAQMKKGKKIRKNDDSYESKPKISTEKSTFATKNVGKILPETSEVEMSRKRYRKEIKNNPESTKKGNKCLKMDCNQELNCNVIKPSIGNQENSKPLKIKPSTKTTSGWQVSAFSLKKIFY